MGSKCVKIQQERKTISHNNNDIQHNMPDIESSGSRKSSDIYIDSLILTSKFLKHTDKSWPTVDDMIASSDEDNEQSIAFNINYSQSFEENRIEDLIEDNKANYDSESEGESNTPNSNIDITGIYVDHIEYKQNISETLIGYTEINTNNEHEIHGNAQSDSITLMGYTDILHDHDLGTHKEHVIRNCAVTLMGSVNNEEMIEFTEPIKYTKQSTNGSDIWNDFALQ
eukprot:257939_1